MILGQTVQTAKVSATVGTLKRKKRILPTLLALHGNRAPFLPLPLERLYVFLKSGHKLAYSSKEEIASFGGIKERLRLHFEKRSSGLALVLC